MPFENFCELWSLTSAFGDVVGSSLDGSNGGGGAGFQPLVALFDTWTSRLPSLNGATEVLRIAAAVEGLVAVLCDQASIASCSPATAQLDELERRTAVAESAAQRFRHAHETLAEAVAHTLESGGDTLPPAHVQARDAAFDELRASQQLLDECVSRLDLDALCAASKALLAPIEAALVCLEQAAGVELTAALQNDDAADDQRSDVEAVEACGTALRRTALSLLQSVQNNADAAQQFAEHCFARDGTKMMQAASLLRESMCALVVLRGEVKNAPLAAVIRSTPWSALLACAARRLAPLRAVDKRAESLKTQAVALSSEASAFASGFADREQIVSLMQERHKAMKRARTSYRRLKFEHDAFKDGDPDAESVDPKKLARQRDACRIATASHDESARQLFLAAKAYHPETLVDWHKCLRLIGLSAVWSERTLDEYDNCVPLKSQGRHPMLKATFAGKPCVLKLVQLQQGQALCKEAEVLRRLDHPNIVTLEAAFVHAHSLHLHFSYATHGDLEHYLEFQAGGSTQARISATQLRRMARQLCEAVAYLAERNIVHCDVKPANVFVDGDGSMPTAILGDFDVSHTASGRTATMTVALQTRGVAMHYSAGYAAPEVVRAPAGRPPQATSKLDVFGLGCVIYRMHMYPRALPEPQSAEDNVASRAGLFEERVSGNLPACAVPAWAKAAPRDAIAGATRANPTARLSPRELLQTDYMRLADGEYARMAVQRPAYWQYQEHEGSWFVREGAEVMMEVEKLLNDTAKPEENGIGRDGHGIRFARFKVTGVHRVENSHVWSAYAARRRALADALTREGYTLPEAARRLSTSHFTYPLESGSLEGAAGEVFLFHGTGFPQSIASSGFDVRYAYAGAGAGAMFGHGVYFGESATKSDQYVRANAEGKLTMVLARVCLGRCEVVHHARYKAPFLPEVGGMSTAAMRIYYDSILTNVSSMRFREVVVGRDTAAYPELLVEYERVS